MPLQNRVKPDGEIVAEPHRGTMMGNRGGVLHTPDRKLRSRRWVSRRWIACVLLFRGRHRQVMGPGYTELFFLDEATALAAGHRPCYECRRADALTFAEAWRLSTEARRSPTADEMDLVLHGQRLAVGGAKVAVSSEIRDLPDGAIFLEGDRLMLVHAGSARAWSFEGYGPVRPLPHGRCKVLTPPAIIDVLKAGYVAKVHASVEDPV